MAAREGAEAGQKLALHIPTWRGHMSQSQSQDCAIPKGQKGSPASGLEGGK